MLLNSMRFMYIHLIICFTLLLSNSCSRDSNAKQSPPVVDVDGIISPGVSGSTITMDQFMGANGFVDDPIDKLKAIGFLREYHNWGWDEGNWEAGYQSYPHNHMAWAPSMPGWSFDDFYTNLKKDSIMVSPCIQGAASWLNATNNFPFNNKPVDEPGLNTLDPNSYHKKSHHLYQFVARYGSAKVDAAKLTLAPGQPALSGLGLIKYIEDWNEQDKSWEGKDAEFSPEEYAAMASADYDGHCNTMTGGNGTFGAKNADPNIKYVMGGLVDLNLDYIKRMKIWFEANRKDKKFATDVINFHVYAWKDGNSWQGGGPALSPEAAAFKERVAAITTYRDKNMPEVEVWISEFGWDTNPQSPLCAPAIGNFDIQDVQGMWLVRAYMAFAAAGVDRAQMFSLRDGNPADPTWFSSSGLIGPKDNFAPKKSWYYIYTMKNLLKNMKYAGEQKANNSDVLIYKFKNNKTNEGVYAIWAKTSEGKNFENVPVTLSANAKTATQTDMVAGHKQGVSSTTTIQNGKIYVNVSEKPVFVKVDVMQ